MMDMIGHGLGMGWWWIIGITILVVVIWVIVNRTNQQRSLQKNEQSAIDVLRDRYARGEIDKEEFEKRKKVLM